MPITISDTSIVVDGSKSTWSVPSPVIFMGEIVRLYNSSSTTQTYDYTDTSGILTSSNVAAFTSSYVLVKSGSVEDSYDINVTFIGAIKLFLTSSELGNTFSEQLITTTGAGTWTKPTGVTQVIVECWGGGGSGAGATGTNSGGGGGAAGQYVRKLIIYDSLSSNIPYSVAASVVGTTGDGTTGNDTTWNTNQVVAKGGAPGLAFVAGNGNPGLVSSTGAVGDIVHLGGNGGDGFFNSPSTVIGGRGGPGPGSTGDVGNIATEGVEYGGRIALNIQLQSGGQDGNPGNNYGGGGGGAAKVTGANRSGGNGAQGLIRILYR